VKSSSANPARPRANNVILRRNLAHAGAAFSPTHSSSCLRQPAAPPNLAIVVVLNKRHGCPAHQPLARFPEIIISRLRSNCGPPVRSSPAACPGDGAMASPRGQQGRSWSPFFSRRSIAMATAISADSHNVVPTRLPVPASGVCRNKIVPVLPDRRPLAIRTSAPGVFVPAARMTPVLPNTEKARIREAATRHGKWCPREFLARRRCSPITRPGPCLNLLRAPANKPNQPDADGGVGLHPAGARPLRVHYRI